MLRALRAPVATICSTLVAMMVIPGVAAAATKTHTKYVNVIPVGWLVLVVAVVTALIATRKELLRLSKEALKRRRSARKRKKSSKELRSDFKLYLHVLIGVAFVMAVLAMLTIYHHSFDVTLWLR